MTNILLAVGALCGLIAYLSIGVCVGNVSKDDGEASFIKDMVVYALALAGALVYAGFTTPCGEGPSLEMGLELVLGLIGLFAAGVLTNDNPRLPRTLLWPLHLVTLVLEKPGTASGKGIGRFSVSIAGVIVWLAVGAAKLPINIGNYLTEMVKDV